MDAKCISNVKQHLLDKETRLNVKTPHEYEIHTSNIRQQTEQTPLTLVVDFAEKARKVREVN